MGLHLAFTIFSLEFAIQLDPIRMTKKSANFNRASITALLSIAHSRVTFILIMKLTAKANNYSNTLSHFAPNSFILFTIVNVENCNNFFSHFNLYNVSFAWVRDGKNAIIFITSFNNILNSIISFSKKCHPKMKVAEE